MNNQGVRNRGDNGVVYNHRVTLVVVLLLSVTLMFTDGWNNVRYRLFNLFNQHYDQEEFASEPCKEKNNNGYAMFEKRHILSEDFDTNSADAWLKYLKAKGLCGRVKYQSFINKADTDKVKDICNGKGVRDSGDLCISKDKFTVYIVESTNDGQCVVKNIDKRVGQYVVVACDLVENQCLPVHYQKQTNTPPPPYGEICKPKTK